MSADVPDQSEERSSKLQVNRLLMGEYELRPTKALSTPPYIRFSLRLCWKNGEVVSDQLTLVEHAVRSEACHRPQIHFLSALGSKSLVQLYLRWREAPNEPCCFPSSHEKNPPNHAMARLLHNFLRVLEMLPWRSAHWNLCLYHPQGLILLYPRIWLCPSPYVRLSEYTQGVSEEGPRWRQRGVREIFGMRLIFFLWVYFFLVKSTDRVAAACWSSLDSLWFRIKTSARGRVSQPSGRWSPLVFFFPQEQCLSGSDPRDSLSADEWMKRALKAASLLERKPLPRCVLYVGLWISLQQHNSLTCSLSATNKNSSFSFV